MSEQIALDVVVTRHDPFCPHRHGKCTCHRDEAIEQLAHLRKQNESHAATNELLNIREEQIGVLLESISAITGQCEVVIDEKNELLDQLSAAQKQIGDLMDERIKLTIYGYSLQKQVKEATKVMSGLKWRFLPDPLHPEPSMGKDIDVFWAWLKEAEPVFYYCPRCHHPNKEKNDYCSWCRAKVSPVEWMEFI